MSETLITGEILLPPNAEISANAVIYVHLLDSSRADAPSRVVAKQVIENVAAKLAEGERIMFAIDGGVLDPRASYSISVHVDVDADGQVSVGDHINVQSYPVATFGFANYVEVRTVRLK